jgi:hypothetical protein
MHTMDCEAVCIANWLSAVSVYLSPAQCLALHLAAGRQALDVVQWQQLVTDKHLRAHKLAMRDTLREIRMLETSPARYRSANTDGTRTDRTAIMTLSQSPRPGRSSNIYMIYARGAAGDEPHIAFMYCKFPHEYQYAPIELDRHVARGSKLKSPSGCYQMVEMISRERKAIRFKSVLLPCEVMVRGKIRRDWQQFA